jgi:hypothetical protein
MAHLKLTMPHCERKWLNCSWGIYCEKDSFIVRKTHPIVRKTHSLFRDPFVVWDQFFCSTAHLLFNGQIHCLNGLFNVSLFQVLRKANPLFGKFSSFAMFKFISIENLGCLSSSDQVIVLIINLLFHNNIWWIIYNIAWDWHCNLS